MKRYLNISEIHFFGVKIVFRVALFVSLLFFSGAAYALNVTMSVKAEGDGKPTITGTTNLPDGIDLMITISREESQYMAQDKVTVKGGAFRSGEFSQKGDVLNPGKYTVEVSMPIANVQPPNTWPVIGNDGAKLKGKLVKKDIFGGKVVEYETSIVIGSGQASPEQDKKARKQDQEDRHEWWLRSCSDACKMTRGIAQKRGEAFDWDRCYYKCVADEPTKE